MLFQEDWQQEVSNHIFKIRMIIFTLHLLSAQKRRWTDDEAETGGKVAIFECLRHVWLYASRFGANGAGIQVGNLRDAG